MRRVFYMSIFIAMCVVAVVLAFVFFGVTGN